MLFIHNNLPLTGLITELSLLKGLPHVGVTNTERNRTKNSNSMSSSYNTPCCKHKLVASIYSNTETSLAMYTLAVWCRVVRSRYFSTTLPPTNCITVIQPAEDHIATR